MSTAALKILRDTLKTGAFKGAYYVCGEDDFQKEDATKQLIAASVDPSTRDFNLDIRRAQDLDSKSLDAALSAMPMMADRRVIVIRDASVLKKDAKRVLEKYLESPAPDVVLILVEGSAGKTDRELAKNSTVLEFDRLTGDRVPKWIAHYASTELQTRITPEAAELLQTAVGTDLHHLVAELDKLASYVNGREIDESAVAAVVGVTRGETMADFLDQVAMQNFSRALELIPHVLAQPKTSGVQLVMALATQTLALAWGRAKMGQGLTQNRLAREYFDLLKESGSPYTGRTWGSAVATWARAVDRWTPQSLDRAADALLEADIALKDTRFSSEEQVLATLVLSMSVEGRTMAAA
ncbi:MAG TPA: DNA polymerase III subunit delta [Gemmatimonadaceae bacterium]|nr:DNA polymerase III subunit delta [Gemmatimonadaceae bacterium]